jgi:hypothetical protein
VEFDHGQVSLGGVSGSEAFRVTSVASQVNRLEVLGAATGGGVTLSANGETNINMTIAARGTGVMLLNGPASSEVLRLGATAGAGSNAIQISAGAAGSDPVILARGGDTNRGVIVRGKGTGGGSLQDGASAKKLEWNTTGVGFFAATPVAKQTVSAALATDGSATSADMATAINALRTALLNYGLVS